MMDEKRLKKLYDNLINDQDFDKLELGLNKPNIFEILKISKTEIRHSNFLYWLLNPKGSHGLGDVFLKRILREIFSSEKVIDIDQIEVNKLDLSDIQIRREWKNIDLLLIFDDIVICIENKIFSKEHSNQLQRYKEIVKSEFPHKRQSFVFLTPFGIPSENESDVYVFLSYQTIVDSLGRQIKYSSSWVFKSKLRPPSGFYKKYDRNDNLIERIMFDEDTFYEDLGLEKELSKEMMTYNSENREIEKLIGKLTNKFGGDTFVLSEKYIYDYKFY